VTPIESLGDGCSSDAHRGSSVLSHVHVPDLKRHVSYVTDKSYGLLTGESEARHVAIFVHGFGGHPFKTWSQVQELIAADDRWKGTDIYFIGYDSIRDEVRLSATYLVRIIRQLCPEPPAGIFSVRARERTSHLRADITKYESIDLIGHSLGGVVLRVAVLELLGQGLAAADSDEASEMPSSYFLPCNARMRLFAPAQGGARISGLKGMVRHVVGFQTLVDLFRGRSPSFQELEPGSQLLDALREDTNYYADLYPNLRSFRARICWAHHDDIVTSLPFRHDVSYTMRDTDHLSVCKPSRDFLAPFTFVYAGALEESEGAL
jgi:pimeloyl-ACP methyl ester carboxylesterase